MSKNVVIGIGNTVLSDDGVGPCIVRRAEELLGGSLDNVDFRENYSGGFDLLYDLTGYDRALLIDSIVTGACEPGTCMTFTLANFDELECERLVDSHGINLPTVIETGRRCGYKMPGELLIFGVESEDVTTFSERLTDKVKAGVDEVVARIHTTLLKWKEQETARID